MDETFEAIFLRTTYITVFLSNHTNCRDMITVLKRPFLKLRTCLKTPLKTSLKTPLNTYLKTWFKTSLKTWLKTSLKT